MKSNSLKYYYNQKNELEKIEELDGEDIIYSYEVVGNMLIKRFFREGSVQIKLFESRPIMQVLSFDDYYIVKIKNENELRDKTLFHIEKFNGFLFPCLISEDITKKLELLDCS